MSEFQIFSDGSCDMERNVAAEHNINIIPFYVSLDYQHYYKEIEELSLETFYKNIVEEHNFPKTSLPSVQDYADAFTPVLEKGQDIICFTITDTLSGSYQSATTAKLMLEETYPDAKIYIVNSWNATGSQYLMALEASKMQKAGHSIDEVYAFAEKSRADSRIFFMIGSLKHLEKGGRIGKIAALSGSILNIKPLIVLKGGEISLAGVARSRKKGMQKLADLTRAHFEKNGQNPADYRFVVGTTNTWEEVEPFQDFLKNAIPQISFRKAFQIGATIATHTGPGTLGICLVKKFESYL